MLRVAFALTFLLVLVHANAFYDIHEDILMEEWETFKQQHGKNYTDDREEQYRRNIYIENRKKIARHNFLQSQNGASFTLKMNEYGDMLHSEFVKYMNGYRRSTRARNSTLHLPANNVVVPAEYDWRQRGFVTPVKNQKHCGSCWAFSSTGALEGQHFRKTKKLVSLSEQNLVDCSTKFGNNGCNGGLMDNAFEYISSNHGIDTEASYPYEARDSKCRYKSANKGADDIGFIDIEAGSEEALLEALATVGPIAIAIDASHESFQFYSEGVYDEKECSAEELDHGVLVVGYGEDKVTKQKFWIVKNSWGTTWGENGFIRMIRGKNNQCGVASAASYPRV